jgi:hypothetical protein
VAVSKKNPLAAEISMIGERGAPDVLLGRVDFKILDAASGLIAGALRGTTGQRVGMVTIDGFPLGEVATAKGPGRPPADEKHLAVLLAWALKCAELGGKMGEADDQTAALFDYSGGDKIRKIRNPLAAKIGLDLDKDTLYIIDDSAADEGPPVCSILIEKPTIYETPGSGLEILGAKAIAWGAEMCAHVKCLPAVRIVIDIAEPGDGLAAWKARRGPKIISIIRPGR